MRVHVWINGYFEQGHLCRYNFFSYCMMDHARVTFPNMCIIFQHPTIILPALPSAIACLPSFPIQPLWYLYWLLNCLAHPFTAMDGGVTSGLPCRCYHLDPSPPKTHLYVTFFLTWELVSWRPPIALPFPTTSHPLSRDPWFWGEPCSQP